MFTRPDDTPVGVYSSKVVSFAPVPTSGPTMGPLREGTRIVFENRTHQDVKELVAEVERRLNGSGVAALEAMLPTAASAGKGRTSRRKAPAKPATKPTASAKRRTTGAAARKPAVKPRAAGKPATRG
jgi:hypothetical protein